MSRLLRIALLTLLLVGSSELRAGADGRPSRELVSGGDQALSLRARPMRDSLARRASAIHLSQMGATLPSDELLHLPTSGVVRHPHLLLRVGPATHFAPLGLAALPPGTRLPVRSVLRGGGWVEVEWQGEQGWLPASGLLTD